MSAGTATAPSASAGCAPMRRAHALRRTTSIDASWPDGVMHAMHFDARGRDLFTGAAGSAPRVLAFDQVQATLAPDRSVLSLRCEPPRAGIAGLIGARGGNQLRAALDQVLPAERQAGSPLYLLLDDFAGASLVAGWAWRRWAGLPATAALPANLNATIALRLAQMTDICTGFAAGSPALTDSDGSGQNFAPVVPLPRPDDPWSWHALPQIDGMSMRRARRIDVWRDADTVHIDAMFQDSATEPSGGRVAVHEYTLQAQADAATLRLTAVQAQPRVLPYAQCPGAAQQVHRLVGAPLQDLRSAVLDRLPGVLGCTHLNDAMRALADLPPMLQALDAAG